MVFNYFANVHLFFEICKFLERNPKNQWNFRIIIQKFNRNFGLGRFYGTFFPPTNHTNHHKFVVIYFGDILKKQVSYTDFGVYNTY